MDRDQRSRRQKAAATPPPNRRPAPRSMKSRLGLTKQGQPSANRQAPNGRTGGQASRPQQRPTAQRNAGNAAGTRRPQPQQNPQKPAYRQNPNRRPPRRVTHAEQLRRRRRRAILGMLLVLAALVAGIILSINLLFKVTDFRVENTDGSTPANTGIYTEDQIIDLLGIAEGDSLFGFSTQEKSQLLLNSLPYLDVAEVDTQMPSTVVVKVQPATERFMMEYGGQWLVLSDHLKVLRTSDSQPEDLIWLEANAPQGQPTTPGSFLSVQQSEEQATAETSHISAQDTLEQLMQELEANNLLAGVSVIDMTDLTELNFLYQGRVSVTLGTANNLDYKIRFAATLILDVDGTGLTASDRGTLDVSRQLEDGNIEATFNADTSTPTPEPTPEGDTDTGDGDSSEEPTPAPEPTPEPEG
nr:FtsQ-type POTRA domain-containing protein [uncultured Gemmiger sp.]